MAGLNLRDHWEGNFLDRIEALEQRIEALERAAAMGLFPNGVTMELPADLLLENLPTSGLQIMDAGSSGATEQGWVEVEEGGTTTGYLRIHATK